MKPSPKLKITDVKLSNQPTQKTKNQFTNLKSLTQNNHSLKNGVMMGFLKKFTNHLTAPDASVQLRFTKCSVVLGENLQGTLDIAVEEDFEATEVRCEIVCVEQAKVIKEVYYVELKRSIPQVVDQTVIIYNAKPVLSGPSHFAKGESRSLPININIPAGARPTYTSLDHGVKWTIKGVLAVDGRPDKTTQTSEIHVITPTI